MVRFGVPCTDAGSTKRTDDVTTHLARYVHGARDAQRLSPQALAALLGYRNVDKGANRVLALERDGLRSNDFLGRLIAALGLEQATVDALVAVDEAVERMAFEDWASVPVEPVLLVLPLLAVQVGVPLPPDARLDEAAALAFATAEAKTRSCRAALVWSRRVTYWIRADGTYCRREAVQGRRNAPYTRLRDGRHLP